MQLSVCQGLLDGHADPAQTGLAPGAIILISRPPSLDWFREQVNAAGGVNYQTSMNDVLRRHVEGREELQCPRRPGGTSLAEETPASRGRRGRDLRCAEAGVRARPSGTARSRGV